MARMPFTKHATDQGRYWSSDNSFEQLRRRLRALDSGHFKQADLGGDPDEEFEKSFSSLAYQNIKSKAPRLLPYIIGFQLIERDEDNTKAVGVFGFKAGELWLYAPIFFVSGDLKGTELLYVRDEDTFVPLKENWINFLLSRKPRLLGEPSQRDTHQLGGLLPNLSRLARLPTGTKYGSDQGASFGGRAIDSWATGFLPFTAAVATFSDRLFAKHAGLSERVDLREVLKNPYFLKLAYDRYQRCPGIKKGFDRFYGSNFFGEQAKQIHGTLSQQRRSSTNLLAPTTKSAAIQELPRPRTSPLASLIERAQPEPHPIKTGALKILHASDYLADGKTNKSDPNAPITLNKPELTDAEREKLLNDTVLIKDERDPHAVSMAYNTQIRMSLINPTETGLYDVLEKPGEFDEMIFIAHPHAGNGRQKFALVIRKSDPRSWLNTHHTNLWVRTEKEDADSKTVRDYYQKWFNNLPEGKLEKGATYVMVGPSGDGTLPFRVKEVYGDESYRVDWQDHCRYGNDRAASLPRTTGFNQSGSDPDYYDSWDAKLTINKRDGAKMRSVNFELFVPDTFKAIKVKDAPKPPKDRSDSLMCGSSLEESSTDPPPVEPGTLADIQSMLYSKMARLVLHDVGAGEIYLKSPLGEERLNKTAALVSLVGKHGFREDTAREMLKEAAAVAVHNRAVKYLVKYAYPYYADGGLLQPGPNAPAFPPPLQGVEQVGYKGFPAIYPQEHFLPVPQLDSNLTDPTIYDPFYMPENDDLHQVAENAADTGQKEVFDTSMFGGMLKSVRQQSMVDQYLGDLMGGLDKLGRILFSVLYHNEAFAERYGKAEMPELEDGVRNAFEGLGDTTLFLLSKDVSNKRQPNKLPKKSEPSIDEVAMS